MSFCHLHLHTEFSLLDGFNRVKAVITRAHEMGMPAIAVTDHGNMFAAVDFHDTARKVGIKPIIGCEVYVAQRGRRSREGRSAGANHLVLLARNQTGYRNLSRLVSLGFLEGFYYRPRIDKELLAAHSEGLIGLSACLKGIVAENLAGERIKDAEREAGELSDILGKGNFYLELQNHQMERQQFVNREMIPLARRLGLPLIATNDCHYLERSDAEAHDLLLCVGTGKTQQEKDRLTYPSDEFYLKSPAEMQALFGEIPESLANTLAIAEQCDFDLGPTEYIFPDFEVPPGFDVDSYFAKVVRDGFSERRLELERVEREGRLRHGWEEYAQRLDHEIRVIQNLKFSAYFLIVWDFIRYARENGIPVGPGRGSAAGSLVSYAMRITDVDPLQYDLLFERFLNPERITPPDIDIDFCMNRRSDVIDYVTRRYGRDNVSHIITFGTMKARAALRDVGRALDIPLADVDKIAKLVPSALGTTLDKSLETVKELRELADDVRYGKLLETARRLEGLSRHSSIHAAGVVIAPCPLVDLVPMYRTNREEITTQYTMKNLERLGLLKMDFLGLTTLTLIEVALAQVSEQLGVVVKPEELPLDDAATLKLFCEGRTSGIFQFESAGMRDILVRLQPSVFEDLIALNALYRPGPIQGGMIDDFINRRHGRVKVTYDMPELEEFLKETYGVIVYQEQVMQIASAVAGFSLGEADLLRRAMGKKKKEEMESQRKKFVDGARERGKDPGTAGKLFDLIQEFAGYGFNKSHSTAYALLAYQTAYLKAHYPVQFMAALLTSEMSNTDKIVQYLAEAREMGIEILPPDINTSELHFKGSGPHHIRFGLAAIRNVGEGAVESILRQRRESGPFKGFFEFCEEMDLRVINKRVLEGLIRAGAFDTLFAKRKSLMMALDRALERAQRRQRDRLRGQRDLFGGLLAEPDSVEPVPDAGEWPDREKWAFEKDAVGFYISGHPLQKYEAEIKGFCRHRAGELVPEMSGQEVSLGGLAVGARKLQTRKQETMAVFQLEDMTGSVEVVVFPAMYERYKGLLFPDAVPSGTNGKSYGENGSTGVAGKPGELLLCVRGRCDVDSRGELKVLGSELMDLSQVWKMGVRRATIRIPLTSVDPHRLDRLQDLVSRSPGSCSLEFELRDPAGLTLQVVPRDPVMVNPAPEFVRELERLFGEKSCILEFPR